MDVLFISLDFPEWRQARSWSYAANLGLEEGFRANNIDFMTIPALSGMSTAAASTTFLGRIRDLCSGRRFDQVWVELVHSPLDDNLLEYLSTLAPVRLGLLGESLQYAPDVYAMAPHLRERRTLVESRLRYMTHALVGDERDVESCNRRGLVKAMWWVSSVPERFIEKRSGPLPADPATFSGAVYGVRSGWLGHPSLENLLVRPAPLEDATPWPGLFDKLNSGTFNALRGGMVATEGVLEEYLAGLRRIRRECFSLWLDGLRQGCAVVNLPSFLQAYPGRVVEGMAAGRPVIAWEIPDRPRNSALFKDGDEILLYPKDEPDILAQRIRRLQQDPGLAERIVRNARRRIFRFHTAESRVRQVLEWMESGREPAYHDDFDVKRPSPHAVAVPSAGTREADPTRVPGDVGLRLKEGNLETALDTGDLAKVARHLSEALRIRPEDPELWLEVMRLSVMNNDGKTAETAMDRAMDLCPDRKDLFAALRNISANGNRGIDLILDRIKENIFYENMFLKDPSWSSPGPNQDEEARWGKIEYFLNTFTDSHVKKWGSKPRILDLGCGRGWLSNLASRYGHIEGIDPVREVIKGAGRLFPHLRLQHGTARTILDNPDFIPYDLILSSEVIEHVPNSEKERFVNDLFRLIKPEGCVILTTPRGEAYDSWKKRTNFVDQPVEEWLTEAELVGLFESQGFEAIGNDRIYVDLRTLGYGPLPGNHPHNTADFLGLYQVWEFQSRETGCRKPQRSEGRGGETLTVGKAEGGLSVRKTGHPLVSVIVPTHNRPEMLAAAIRSILDQTYRNIEIVVVNDAGEGVEEVVAGLNRDGRIAYVRHDRNRGLAAARNTGLRVARGKYIAYLDDDDLYYPDHIETLVSFLEASEYRVAYTDAYRAVQEKRDGRYVVTAKDQPYANDFDPKAILVSNLAPVLSFMHEKACLDEIGFFDETLSAHEDWDLWIRMSRVFPIVRIPKITCEFSWRGDGSTMSSSRFLDYLWTIGRVYAKHQEWVAGDPDLVGKQNAFVDSFARMVAASPGNGPRYECSVIVPVYNNVDLTKECVRSVAEKTAGGPSFEMIFVDNNSTDGAAEFLKTLGGDVTVITNESNLGFARACNQAALAARGKHLVFLNNDTSVREGWLDGLLRAAKEPGVGICGAKLLYPGGKVQHAGIAFMEPGIGYHIFRNLPADAPAVNRRRYMHAVTAACMLVKRDLFLSLGGFDEGYRNGYEDVDFCLRAGERGHRVLYVPESVVVHHEELSEGRKAFEEENMKRFLSRWRGRVPLDDETYYREEGYKKTVSADGTRITITRVEPHPEKSPGPEEARAGARGKTVSAHRPDAGDSASRGRSLKKEKRYIEAVEAFRQARSQGDPSVLADIGDCLAQGGKFEEAEAAYREALKGNPLDPRSLAGLGVLDLVNGNHARAAERFTSVLESNDRDATALCGMGLARKAGGGTGEAFGWFCRALEIDPVNVTALHESVKAAHELGRLEDAERYLSTYLQYEPSDPHILFSLAGVLFRSGKSDEALDALDRLAFFEPSYGGANELRERIASTPQSA